MKKAFAFVGAIACGLVLVTATSCGAEKATGEYEFVILAPDSDNTNLSDNPVVAKYTIKYTDATYVSDSLILKDGKYYFSKKSDDYLVLEDGSYGLSYQKGYFKNYSACANNTEIDVSWSMTTSNGYQALMTGIGSTPLEGLTSYEFVIDGWK